MQKKIIGVLMLCLVAAFPAWAGGGKADESGKAAEDERLKALVLFILDVEMYKGVFYGQYDYCAPKVPSLIARQTLRIWRHDNAAYFAAQQQAELQYIAAMKARGGTESWARKTIGAQKKKNFDHLHDDKRYISQNLEPQQDKERACSRHLGVLVSHSMTFESLSPEGYRYWQQHYAK